MWSGTEFRELDGGRSEATRHLCLVEGRVRRTRGNWRPCLHEESTEATSNTVPKSSPFRPWSGISCQEHDNICKPEIARLSSGGNRSREMRFSPPIELVVVTQQPDQVNQTQGPFLRVASAISSASFACRIPAHKQVHVR